MSENDDEIPILKDVVRRGDEDVIKTARLEREIFEELDLFNPARRESRGKAGDGGMTPVALKSGPLPKAIDNIIEHHSQRMRQEIAELLRHRLGKDDT